MRGEKSRRGRRSTTKKGRTAVWDIGRRRSLLHRWGRLSPATLCWLRRPQPQTRSRKVSYDLVREERGQVRGARTVEPVRTRSSHVWPLGGGSCLRRTG